MFVCWSDYWHLVGSVQSQPSFSIAIFSLKTDHLPPPSPSRSLLFYYMAALEQTCFELSTLKMSLQISPFFSLDVLKGVKAKLNQYIMRYHLPFPDRVTLRYTLMNWMIIYPCVDMWKTWMELWFRIPTFVSCRKWAVSCTTARSSTSTSPLNLFPSLPKLGLLLVSPRLLR